MNHAQQRHVKAMARKIEQHAQAIMARMQALQRNSLYDMPDTLVPSNFADTLYYAQAIERVYSEMLPNLAIGTIEKAWVVYLERADTDEKAKPIGVIDAASMAEALHQASRLYEYPSHDLVVKEVSRDTILDLEAIE